MRPKLILDQKRCLSCRSCELACIAAHSEAGTLDGALEQLIPPKNHEVGKRLKPTHHKGNDAQRASRVRVHSTVHVSCAGMRMHAPYLRMSGRAPKSDESLDTSHESTAGGRICRCALD